MRASSIKLRMNRSWRAELGRIVRIVDEQAEHPAPVRQVADLGVQFVTDAVDDEVVLHSGIETSWSDSFHYCTLEFDWKPWRYGIAIALWDEPFTELSFLIDPKSSQIDAL